MKLQQRFRLETLAVIGILLFAVINWQTLRTGSEQPNAIPETRPAISKEAAAEKAEALAASMGGGSGFVPSVIYHTNRLLSGYVQQEKLAADYKARFASRVPVDYYRVELAAGGRIVYIVDINMTDGGVIGWEKAGSGEAGSREAGRKIAEAYLQARGHDLSEYRLERQTQQHPERFVYEHRTDHLNGAPYRLIAEVRGGEVTAFRQDIRIPNRFLAWIDQQDRLAAEMTQWNLAISSLMGVAAIVLAVKFRRQIPFTRGILLTAAFLGIYVMHNINSFSAFKTLMPETADPFQSDFYAWTYVILMCVIAALMAAVLYFSIAASAPYGEGIGGNALWTGWRDKHFGDEMAASMKRGYMLACFMLGLQSLLFFTAEQRFGMWAVNDPSGSLYNMARPELFPLMAWAAAISEEAIYRVFGIAIFKKLFRNTFAAVLVPSVIWALSHTQYSIYPVYTRLIEVTILGIILGYAYLKYGFATAVFTHAILNSALMGFALAGLGSTYYLAIGLLYIAFPAAAAFGLRMLHQRLRPKAT